MRLGCLRPAIWLRSDLGCGSLFQESLFADLIKPRNTGQGLDKIDERV